MTEIPGRSAVEAADRGRYATESGGEIVWEKAVRVTQCVKLSIPLEFNFPIGCGSNFHIMGNAGWLYPFILSHADGSHSQQIFKVS